MTPLIVSLVYLVFVACLVPVTRFLRRSSTLQWLETGREVPGRDPPAVAIVLPVRNESFHIERCLSGLVAQSYSRLRLRIIVVDDGSEDDTADRVRRMAATDDRIVLIAAGPLPSGWTGKCHACWRGAEAAQEEWLCFVDADTVGSPRLVSSAIQFAEERRIDLLSLLPYFELESFWERLILPWVVLLLEIATRFFRFISPGGARAVAVGHFLLFRRAVYLAIGGHSAIRTEQLDDVKIARRAARGGFRVQTLRGDRFIRVRMYRGFREIWIGLSRISIDMMGNPFFAILLVSVALVWVWAPFVLPGWLAWELATAPSPGGQQGWALAIVSAASAGVVIQNLLIMAPFRIPRWYGLLVPLGVTTGCAIALHSTYLRARGRTHWKGRVYPSTR